MKKNTQNTKNLLWNILQIITKWKETVTTTKYLTVASWEQHNSSQQEVHFLISCCVALILHHVEEFFLLL